MSSNYRAETTGIKNAAERNHANVQALRILMPLVSLLGIMSSCLYSAPLGAGYSPSETLRRGGCRMGLMTVLLKHSSTFSLCHVLWIRRRLSPLHVPFPGVEVLSTGFCFSHFPSFKLCFRSNQINSLFLESRICNSF